MQENTGKYPSAMKVMHWFMAFLLFAMIAVGWYVEDLDKAEPIRAPLVLLHKSFGITLLFLAVLRIVIRLRSPKPALPAGVKPIEEKAAKTTYAFLYALMVIIPITGYSMSTLYGLPVKWFGYELPKLLPVDRDLGATVRELHGILAYGMLALIGLHLAGFLKHLVIDKINLLKRMW